jgi:hypothetical protein
VFSSCDMASEDNLDRVWSIIERVGVCMLTTRGVRRLPDRACDIAITQRFGGSGDRQIGVFILVDENEADLVVGGDFVVFIPRHVE